MKKRLVVGLSGASGAILCVSLLEAMRREKDWEVHLVTSEAGERVLHEQRVLHQLAAHRCHHCAVGSAELLARGADHRTACAAHLVQQRHVPRAQNKRLDDARVARRKHRLPDLAVFIPPHALHRRIGGVGKRFTLGIVEGMAQRHRVKLIRGGRQPDADAPVAACGDLPATGYGEWRRFEGSSWRSPFTLFGFHRGFHVESNTRLCRTVVDILLK